MKALLTSVFTFPALLGIAVISAAQVLFDVKGGHLLLIALALVVLWYFSSQFAARAKIRKRTLSVYKEENPSCFIGLSLTCNACNGGHIVGRPHPQHPEFREHTCKDCGNSLFYSRR